MSRCFITDSFCKEHNNEEIGRRYMKIETEAEISSEADCDGWLAQR
jgi:hypothetical protein